jgi:hypothetical protein
MEGLEEALAGYATAKITVGSGQRIIYTVSGGTGSPGDSGTNGGTCNS